MTEETTISIHVSKNLLRHIDDHRGGNGVKVGEDALQFNIADRTYLKLWNTEVDLND